MRIGLAGIGTERDWQVDIDAMAESEHYGLTITSRQYWLQVAGLALDRLVLLQRFLSTNTEQERFLLHSAFGGKLEFVRHEGKLALRIVEAAKESDTNLLEITLHPEDRTALAAALGQAIEDANSPPDLAEGGTSPGNRSGGDEEK
jgi:hypothetical protein